MQSFSGGITNGANILDGLHHPSGANAERIAYFLGKKQASQLSIKTDPKKIDASKVALFEKMQGIRNAA